MSLNKKWFFFFSVIVGFICLVAFVYIRPQYAFKRVPSPSGNWSKSEFTIRKYGKSRDYYILRKFSRINITANDVGINTEEDIIQFYENWFDLHDLNKGNQNSSVTRCESLYSGISLLNEIDYIAHFYPKEDDRFYTSKVVCVVIYPCDNCVDEVLEILLITGNPHWLDKIEFEFTHPRAY